MHYPGKTDISFHAEKQEAAAMTPEEKFTQLLARLKGDEPVYTGEPSHISAFIRPEPTPQLRARAIQIMESPMFYQGGLRGKKLPVAGKPRFKVLPVPDLESLVMLLAEDLEKHQTGKLGVTDLKAHFKRLLKDFEELLSPAYEVSDYLVKQRIVTVWEKLLELQEKLPPHRWVPDITEKVTLRIEVFVEANPSEISRAVELLLTHLGIPVKRETARKRIYREKNPDRD
jgi:hypothetical protein